jgi:glutamate--cysteine ligase
MRPPVKVAGRRLCLGAAGEAGGVKLLDLARAAVGLSHAGLVARGLGEEVQLQPLVESLKTGKVQADRWLELYQRSLGWQPCAAL